MGVLPNMHSRATLTRSVDSLDFAWAFACVCACSSMLGIEEIELPRVRERVKAATVGERGVDSVTRDERRACMPPYEGAWEVAAAGAAGGPKARERVVGWVGDSGRGGLGLESNRMVLLLPLASSWAIRMRQSRGNSRSISGSGPSWAVPSERAAPCSGYGWPSGW